MEYTEENSHEKACKIWVELLQKCPHQYHFQKGFSDAARPLSARRRLQLLDEAFPDNNLDHDWVECQKAIAYTKNGLHDEACKTWTVLLQQEKERLVFKEGFLKAIQPLPTDQRLKLLQLVKNDEAVLWVDHAIAMEYYSRKDYENAYQSFSLLCMSQAIKVLKDAIMPLIHSIIRGDRTLIRERLHQLPSTLKSVELGPESTILECYDSLLELGYIRESAELWIQCARNDRYNRSFLARLCNSLHLRLEAQDCLTIWRAFVEASPNNTLLLAEFKIACATHLDDIVVLHTLQQLVARHPENTALFSMTGLIWDRDTKQPSL
jgi:tetratricopeptide (TPR) repeat protein